MPLIQCKLGPTTQNAAGTDYAFERDRFGRYVARVDNLKARAIFLSVEHYVEVDEDPPAEPAKRARRPAPAAVTGLGAVPLPPQGQAADGDDASDDGDSESPPTADDAATGEPPAPAEPAKRGRRPAA